MNWFFDAIIFLFLISTGAWLIQSVTSWKRHKNKQAHAILAVLVLASWGVVFSGSFIAPQRIVVETTQIQISEAPTKSVRAVVLGDLHVGPYRKTAWVQKVVNAVNAQNPDVIFLLGDFVYDNAEQCRYLTPLHELSAPQGVYAVTGNHDHRSGEPELVRAALETLGVQMLDNAQIDLFEDASLYLVGVSDLWYDADLQTAFEGITSEDTVIFLSHNPEVSLYIATYKADLVLSGHTHAGQIRLPFIGSVSEIPSLLGRAYDKGLFAYNTWQMYITPGVGETGPRARLSNPPQIEVLEISY
jgi:predicted MPP superfamily phosphohydrolase